MLTRKKQLPVELLLFLFPVFLFFWPHGSKAVYSIAILVGIFLLISRKMWSQFGRNERLVLFSCAFFFISAFLSIKLDNIIKVPSARLGLYAHFLFVFPLYYLWKTIKPKQEYFWLGLAAGAIIAMLIAIVDILIYDQNRATGIHHPVAFGGYSLLTGAMAFFGLKYFWNSKKWVALILILALMGGIGASLLSGSRGIWIAFPVLLIILSWYAKQVLERKTFVALILVIAISIMGFYFANKQSIDNRLSLAHNEITTYKPMARGPVKDRIEMWRAAWKIFTENPVRGAGVGAYNNELARLVASKEFDEYLLRYKEPHSDYLTVLSERGLIGLTALLAIYLVPLGLFISLVRIEGGNDFALAGIVFVLLFMHFGLSGTSFTNTMPTFFYIFYLSALTYFAVGSSDQTS